MSRKNFIVLNQLTDAELKRIDSQLQPVLLNFVTDFAPIIFISAVTGQRAPKIFKLIDK